ncbi:MULTISPECIES: acetylxylan esterase [Actinoalloteichus]|nr:MULTISPECIES: acetylxylan esterase [Actinoalloteichus]
MTDLGFRPNLDGYHDASLDLLRQVYARTERRIDEWRAVTDGVATPADVAAYQERVRAAVHRGVGGLPVSEHPLGVRWLGSVDAESCRIDRLTFESLPGVVVPATLYRPAETGLVDAAEPTTAGGTATARRPAILVTCGHSDLAKADPEYQHVCRSLAAAGFVVLIFDPFGQGERHGYLRPDGTAAVAPGTAEHTYAGVQSWWLGQSAARYFVHDARRAVDLLASLPEVDPARIGVTGNSGGGMLCTLLMAVEPRIAAAAPGTYVCGRRGYLWSGQRQDAEQILLGGTEAGVDHDDLLAVMAPRPVCVLAAEYDFFPYEATVESVARARRIYDLLGAAEALRLVTAPTTHRYGSQLAAAAVAFFTEVLSAPATDTAREGAPGRGRDDETRPRDSRPEVTSTDPAPLPTPTAVLPPASLRCTDSGQLALEPGGAARLLPDLTRTTAPAQAMPLADEQVRDWLTARVQAHRDVPPRPQTRWLPGPEGTDHVFWRAERDLWGAGVVLPARPDTPGPLHVVLLHEGTAELTADHPVTRLAGLVVVVDVRGQGALAVHDRDGLPAEDQASAVYKLGCDLLWLDDSLAAARTFDVLRAVDVLRREEPLRRRHPRLTEHSPVHLHGYGLGAFHALLAAVVDPAVASVTVTDPIVDTDRIRTERLHDEGRGGWQALVPGLAGIASTRRLERMLGDRLRTADR